MHPMCAGNISRVSYDKSLNKTIEAYRIAGIQNTGHLVPHTPTKEVDKRDRRSN